eukprot:g25522.t1
MVVKQLFGCLTCPVVGIGARQIESVSAVKCASIVQEKGQNFSPVVAIEALCTMAKKSSFKLREDFVDMFDISRAAEALAKFPDDARGDAAQSVGAVANSLSRLKTTDWTADSAAKLLWSLARYGKGEEIQKHKQAVSYIELVRDKGRRVHELSYEALTHMLWAVARARLQKRTGDLQSVHTEESDGLLFQIATRRVIDEIDRFPVSLLADIIYTHHEIGIKNERLFRVICPKIVSKQNEIREDQMAKCIKALEGRVWTVGQNISKPRIPSGSPIQEVHGGPAPGPKWTMSRGALLRSGRNAEAMQNL